MRVLTCTCWGPSASARILRGDTYLPRVLCLTFSWFVPYHSPQIKVNHRDIFKIYPAALAMGYILGCYVN